jgi:hypothetical protein
MALQSLVSSFVERAENSGFPLVKIVNEPEVVPYLESYSHRQTEYIKHLWEGNRAINDVARIEHYYNLQSAIICDRAFFGLFSNAGKCHEQNYCMFVICCPRVRDNLAPDNVGLRPARLAVKDR